MSDENPEATFRVVDDAELERYYKDAVVICAYPPSLLPDAILGERTGCGRDICYQPRSASFKRKLCLVCAAETIKGDVEINVAKGSLAELASLIRRGLQ